MASFFSDFWKILKLDPQPFERIKNDPSGFWFALRLFLVVAVLSSLGVFVSSLTNQHSSAAAGLEDIASRSLTLAARFPALADGLTQFAQSAERISTTLEKYQPPLGNPASHLLRGIGEWLSLTLSRLSTWMGAALAVFVVARLFKGKGDIREHFSVFLLGFAPQILGLVSGFLFLNSGVGWLGSLLNFGAWLWSLVIVAMALGLAHDFGKGKAVGVMALTFLVFYVVIPVLVSVPLVFGILARLR